MNGTKPIPTDSVDTGITFHHDSPNCEAPQTILLVTPSAFRGNWQSANGGVEDFKDNIPLESQVEQMPLPVEIAKYEMSLDIRLLAGRHWSKLISPLAAAAVAEFRVQYPIHKPNALAVADAPACAHPEAWANFETVADSRMDGVQLYQHLTAGGPITDGIPSLVGLEKWRTSRRRGNEPSRRASS
jgi:hypothetical protein